MEMLSFNPVGKVFDASSSSCSISLMVCVALVPAIWYTIQAAPQLMRYIVEKGSVTIDGISLTVAKVAEDNFSISAIPHTVSQTVLKDRKVGAVVNLETDIIGKYVEKLLCKGQPEGITRDFLAKYGF